MRQYDKWDRYPYNAYGNAVVVKDLIPETNLVKTYAKYDDNDGIGTPTFVANIVGYQTWKIEDGNRIYSFYDPENKRRVLQYHADLVVEEDPFGPDKCKDCGGPTVPAPLIQISPNTRDNFAGGIAIGFTLGILVSALGWMVLS